jgi:hypothetical protein
MMKIRVRNEEDAGGNRMMRNKEQNKITRKTK